MPQRITIRGLLRFTRLADGFCVFVCLVAAAVYSVHGDFLMASTLIGGAAISAACYYWQPAKFLSSKLLLNKG